MTAKPVDEEAIFRIAAEIPSKETRSEYLQQVCGRDDALLDRVMTLLCAHEKLPDFLESLGQTSTLMPDPATTLSIAVRVLAD